MGQSTGLVHDLPINDKQLEKEFDQFMKRERLDFKNSLTEKKIIAPMASIEKPVYKRAASRIGMGINRMANTSSAA